ncbi:MAG: ATP-binding cassette domain-containing protein [Nitrospirota bacterium]|nr:MAG: ATP-binding cassette domain-containing protein [Nitrospirota bacterium]
MAWPPFKQLAELAHVWRDTRLIVLVAQIAAIYAAILIPFKIGIPLIPGFAELRPANAIPIVTSLLFGPAAAWGAGFGNIIGDCFGTLGPASVFGFLGNFFLGYVPFVLWGNMGPLSSGQPPVVKSWRQGLEFGIICVLASGVCAGIIGWGVELLGLLPFSILAPAIFFNNLVMGFLLAPPLLLFLYPRVKRWGLLYRDIRKNDDQPFDHSHLSASALSHHSVGNQNPNEALAVDIRDLAFQYDTVPTPTLRNVSLKVSQGETVALMGRGGSGKSTLCFTLNGLIPQFVSGTFSGEVRINGQDIRPLRVSDLAGKVGLVFQDFETQLVSTNVEMELRHPLEYMNPPLSFNEMGQRIRWALEKVGLAGLERRDPFTLSGGQRQRLVLASLLVGRPGLFVLDQPMTDLDPEARTQFRALFNTLRGEGLSIIFSAHEPEEVMSADRVCVLHEGQIVWEGPPASFFREPTLSTKNGIRANSLAECFSGLSLGRLPVTVEEAWKAADEFGLTLDPPPSVFQDERVGPVRENSGKMPNKPVLEIENVSFSYEGGANAVEDLSLSIAKGEFMAIVGKNGSGKSTLGKLLNGLLLPSTGKVLVAGHDTRITAVSDLAKGVGYVFQNPDHQIFAESVWEEVAFGARNIGCTQEECELRVRESLAAVGLDEEMSRSQDPFSLTKGERQRVAVASALATKPEVLIFDEPTTGLDAEETDKMMDMFRLLNRQGHTMIMITHAMRLVAENALRCVVVSHGQLVADGSTREIFSQPTLLESCSLEVPPLIRFGQRWGHTLLTKTEVKASLRKKS